MSKRFFGSSKNAKVKSSKLVLPSPAYDYLAINYKNNINDELAKMENRFSLVLINEMYDESLVLLRRRMCWTIKDILYIPLKIQTYPNALNKSQVKLRTTNKSDEVYSYFMNKMKNYMVTEKAVIQEVQFYKSTLSSVKEFCVDVLDNVYSAIGQKMYSNVTELLVKSLVIKSNSFTREFSVTGKSNVLVSLSIRCYYDFVEYHRSPQILELKWQEIRVI